MVLLFWHTVQHRYSDSSFNNFFAVYQPVFLQLTFFHVLATCTQTRPTQLSGENKLSVKHRQPGTFKTAVVDALTAFLLGFLPTFQTAPGTKKFVARLVLPFPSIVSADLAPA